MAPPSSRRPAPPDYRSRRVQLRLFLGTAVVLVLVALLGDPQSTEHWRFLYQYLSGNAAAEGRQVDTRLRSPEEDSRPLGLLELNAPQAKHDDAAARSWEAATARLSARDFATLLLAAELRQEGRELTTDQERRLRISIDAWEAAQTGAQASAESSGEESAAALPTPLRSLLGETPADPVPSALLDLWRKTAWDRVRDDTLLRPAEIPAWSLTLRRLQSAGGEAAPLRVTFLQLFDQPEVYRGQRVLLSGRARLGYRVQAPDNFLGIKEYTILWLRPDLADSPVVAYLLSTPPGFPELPRKDASGETRELDEPVTLQGVFFKRYAYRAQDTIRTAPLLLAEITGWTPPAVPAVPDRPVPPAWVWVLTIGGIAVFSVLLAIFVYRAS